MRYLSLFSGIEACSVAWAPLGWECVAVAEIEPWPSRALAHHYPDVPNLGDVTKVTEAQIAALGRIDVVVFGSPCQDLSVAGKRKGLDGARSGLFFTAMQIVGWARQWCDCRFALWENVPGAFSSNKGRDFAAVVDAMAGLEGTGVPPKGWGTEGCALGSEAMVEWSTLDAQWFGVAQRRRRVFALADFGDWRNRPPILLEPESVRGDTAPSREAGQDITHSVAPCLTSSGRGVERTGDTRGQDPVIAVSVALRGREGGGTAELGGNVAGTLRASGGGGDKPHVLTGLQRPVLSASTGDVSHLPAIAFNSNAQPDEMKFDEHVSAPLTCSQYSAVAIGCDTYNGSLTGDVAATLGTQSGDGLSSGPSVLQPGAVAIGFDILGTPASEVARATEVHTPLRARVPGQLENSTVTMVASGMRVRRLTPVECEKLQGFEPGYTAIPKAKDGPRYKALGNSMAVPVMRWIGRSIDYAMLW